MWQGGGSRRCAHGVVAGQTAGGRPRGSPDTCPVRHLSCLVRHRIQLCYEIFNNHRCAQHTSLPLPAPRSRSRSHNPAPPPSSGCGTAAHALLWRSVRHGGDELVHTHCGRGVFVSERTAENTTRSAPWKRSERQRKGKLLHTHPGLARLGGRTAARVPPVCRRWGENQRRSIFAAGPESVPIRPCLFAAGRAAPPPGPPARRSGQPAGAGRGF